MKVKSLKLALMAAGVLAVSQGALAGAVDYNGYFRANAGSNSEGGKQACFQLAGAGAKYRLGNECGTYGELTLNNDVVKTDDGAVFSAHVMFSIFNNTTSNQNLSGLGASDGQIGLPQVYLQADKVPELGGASAWMGRRYYKREDIHIMDFFYWNPQGFGAGIEDLPIGTDGLKFSYALLRNDDVSNAFTNAATGANGTGLGLGNSATRHDLQLRGLKVNPGGTLEFGVALIQSDTGNGFAKSPVDPVNSPGVYYAPSSNNGNAFTIQHRQADIFGGENKLAVQYMTGSGVANGGTGDLTNGSDYHRTRVVEGLYFQPSATVGGQLIAVYQNDSAHNVSLADASGVTTGSNQVPSSKWTTLGGRIALGLTPHFKLNADLGFDKVEVSGQPSRNLTKFTIAPTLSAGAGYYARPELRLFYTYAKWNNAASAAAAAGDPLSASGVFGGKTTGSVLGFTAESWW